MIHQYYQQSHTYKAMCIGIVRALLSAMTTTQQTQATETTTQQTQATETTTPVVTLTLGRSEALDGEADFDAWVSYVTARIDAESGCDVTVEEHRTNNNQDDTISAAVATTRADGYPAKDAVREALLSIWEAFCADTAAWPVRS
jgi:maltose-binding protein MalE